MNKIKKIILIIIIPFLLLTSCKKETLSNESEIISIINYENTLFKSRNVVHFVVDHEVEQINFENLYEISKGASIQTYIFENLEKPITTAELNYKLNKFSVKVTAENKIDYKIYTLEIYRTQLYTVDYTNDQQLYEVVDVNLNPAPKIVVENKTYSFKLKHLVESHSHYVYINNVLIEKDENDIYTSKIVTSNLNIEIISQIKRFNVTLGEIEYREKYTITDENDIGIITSVLTFDYDSDFIFMITIKTGYEVIDPNEFLFKIYGNEELIDPYFPSNPSASVLFQKYEILSIKENINIVINTDNIKLSE